MPEHNSYLPELDTFRGLACLMVVLTHSYGSSYLAFGETGVDAFFVLSGFLITRIILTHKTDFYFLKSFYIRRGLRILPAYYLLVAATLTISLATERITPLKGLLNVLTFTQKIAFLQPHLAEGEKLFHPKLNHTWSVAIEEQFYLFWPGLLAIVFRRNIWLIGSLLIAASITTRYFGFRPLLLISRTDGLVLGAMLAWITLNRPGLFQKYAAPVAILLALVSFPFFFLKPLVAVYYFFIPLFYASCMALLIRYTLSDRLKVFRHPVLRYIGKMSYSLYLFHYTANWLIDGFFIRFFPNIGSYIIVCLCKWVGGLTFGVLGWEFIEKPIQKVKKRYPYSRKVEARVPPQAPFPAQSSG